MPALTRTAFAYGDKKFTDWLYGSYDKNKLTMFELMYHTPLGPYMDYKLDLRGDEEYLRRYGMSYEDVHDPRKLHQVSSGSRMYGSALSFVSKNVDKLYK